MTLFKRKLILLGSVSVVKSCDNIIIAEDDETERFSPIVQVYAAFLLLQGACHLVGSLFLYRQWKMEQHTAADYYRLIRTCFAPEIRCTTKEGT